jgi:cell division septation protein DedD
LLNFKELPTIAEMLRLAQHDRFPIISTLPAPGCRQPCARATSLLLVLALLPAAACTHTPANQSRPISKDEHSQQPAASVPAGELTPVPVPSQGPRFAVQVAAFDRRPSAEALASRLSDQFGLQTLVAPVEAHGQTLYRVRILVGNRDQAENVADTFLRTQKLKVWIVALP